ncbi:MAG: recombinase family protein [Lachnospiraceae bacterium]|nr:recombinase family protein [Lachnospiraceae bacterium]
MMGNEYGFLRVSTPHQDIGRQRINILKAYPNAILYEEIHSGGDYNGCVVLNKLLKIVQAGDTIIFDSVSRFTRDNVTGPEEYRRLFKMGVNLVFLNEPYINTDNYRKALEVALPRTGTFIDPIIAGVEEALLQLAEQQVQDAFNQANKEMLDIRKRTSQALQKKIAENRILPPDQQIRIGTQKGDTFTTKKKQIALERIKEGIEKGYPDEVIMNNIAGDLKKQLPNSKCKDISRNTYYNYKREILGKEKRVYSKVK